MNHYNTPMRNTFPPNSNAPRNFPSSSIAPDGDFPVIGNPNIPVTPTLPEIGNPEDPSIPIFPTLPEIGNPEDPSIPIFPTLPEIGNPEDPSIPIFPTLPEIGNPEDPSIPIFPTLPDIGIPDTGLPTFPIFPGDNNDSYAHVRFLHAASGYGPLNIIISSYTTVYDLAYAQASDYIDVLDGFRTVIVVSSNAPRRILLKKTIPFRSGAVETMAIINTKDGLDIVAISDTTCQSKDRYTSCFRVANLSYGSGPLDTMLSDGKLIFDNTMFKEVTVFRRLRNGYYQFYVTENMDVPMPIIRDCEIIEPINTNCMVGSPSPELVLSYDMVVQTNKMYTAYYIGGDNRNNPMQVVILN